MLPYPRGRRQLIGKYAYWPKHGRRKACLLSMGRNEIVHGRKKLENKDG